MPSPVALRSRTAHLTRRRGPLPPTCLDGTGIRLPLPTPPSATRPPDACLLFCHLTLPPARAPRRSSGMGPYTHWSRDRTMVLGWTPLPHNATFVPVRYLVKHDIVPPRCHSLTPRWGRSVAFVVRPAPGIGLNVPSGICCLFCYMPVLPFGYGGWILRMPLSIISPGYTRLLAHCLPRHYHART